MEFKMSLLGIIVLVGVILAIVALALTWVSGLGMSFSGFDYIEAAMKTSGAPIDLYIPLICLILAIVALVMALLEFLGMGNMMFTRIPVMVIGLLIVMLCVYMARDGLDGAKIGFYLEIVAGIVLLIAPLLSILKILPEE